MLVFAGSWALLHQGFYRHDQIVDTPVYQRYGELMVDGKTPYSDFGVEYPPGALIAFVLPSIGAHDRSAQDYRRRFELLMLLCGCAAIAAMAVALVGLRAGSVALGGALAFAALAPLALGPVIQTRFDLLPTALTVVALAALVHDRPKLGLGLLGAGTAVKVFPAVIVPLALAYVWRRRGAHEAVLAAAVFAAIIGAVLLPFALVAPHGLFEAFNMQLRRPLQIESLGAASLIAAHHLAGVGVRMEPGFGSENLVGSAADALANTQARLQAAAVLVIWIWFALRPRGPRELVGASAGAVCAFIALGKVLSPQFLIWLIPLVPLVRGRRGLAASTVLAATLVLTQLWFPQHYWDYAGHFEPRESWLVLFRDLLLVALALVLLVVVRGRRRRPTPQGS
jgi:hypothetical protein